MSCHAFFILHLSSSFYRCSDDAQSCGLLFEWIYSSVSGAGSQKTGKTLNYAADLPHGASALVCVNSERRGQGSNQVQALYIDFLKVLLFFLLQQSFSKRVLVGILSLGFIGLSEQSQPRGVW